MTRYRVESGPREKLAEALSGLAEVALWSDKGRLYQDATQAAELLRAGADRVNAGRTTYIVDDEPLQSEPPH